MEEEKLEELRQKVLNKEISLKGYFYILHLIKTNK